MSLFSLRTDSAIRWCMSQSEFGDLKNCTPHLKLDLSSYGLVESLHLNVCNEDNKVLEAFALSPNLGWSSRVTRYIQRCDF